MSSEDDGYVHRPGAARDDDEESAEDVADDSPATAGADSPGAEAGEADSDAAESLAGAHPDEVDRELDTRGWVLVAVLGFSLIGAPLLILWRPPVLPYWAALLALPMLPAILLGLVGVWATTRP